MTAVAVTAPACPTWCAVHAPDADWDEIGRNVTKTCRLEVQGAEDIDGGPVLVELSRFADLDDGVIEVEAPAIEIHYGGRIGIEQYARLAAEVDRLAALASAEVAA